MKRLNGIKNHFWIILLPGILSSCGVRDNSKDEVQLYAGTFSFTHELKLPGIPVQIYDACTGEVSDWWDHSFSEKPFSIYLDARVGGSFFETFDTLGNGALYATVTYADRGRVLRFEGPMGLSGQAILFVHTYTFQASGADSTRMTLEVRASGEMTNDLPDMVESVWHHFLFDQFKPYMESSFEF